MKRKKNNLSRILPISMVVGVISLQAKADLLVTFEENGSKIDVTYSGSLNKSGLQAISVGGGRARHQVYPQRGGMQNLVELPGDAVLYSFDVSGLVYGTGGERGTPGSAVGSHIDIRRGALGLARNYQSGSPLSGSFSISGSSFSQLGIVPGTYSSTANNGSGNAITYQVGSAPVSAVPEPSSSLALAGLLALGIFGRRRR